MTKEEIRKLGSLSRIALSEAEVETFNQEIDSILEYVGVVTKIAGTDTPTEPFVGMHYNVLRKDEVINTPGSFTKAMLAEMPKTTGQYLSVKKILKQAE